MQYVTNGKAEYGNLIVEDLVAQVSCRCKKRNGFIWRTISAVEMEHCYYIGGAPVRQRRME